MKEITAIIDYDLTEAWERWAVSIAVPDEVYELLVDPDQDAEDGASSYMSIEEYIRENPDKIEFITMKDSGNSTMSISEIEGISG